MCKGDTYICSGMCKPGDPFFSAVGVRVANGFCCSITVKKAATDFARFVQSYFTGKPSPYELTTFIYKMATSEFSYPQYGYGAVYTNLLPSQVLPTGLNLARLEALKLGTVVANVHNHPNNDKRPSGGDSLNYSLGGYNGYVTDQNGNVGGSF